MEFINIAIKAIITAAAGGVFTAAVVWIKNQYTKGRIQDRALKALSHDSFFRMCRYILAKGSMSEDELENLNYLHDTYKGLGMNGTGDELYRRCLELPIK